MSFVDSIPPRWLLAASGLAFGLAVVMMLVGQMVATAFGFLAFQILAILGLIVLTTPGGTAVYQQKADDQATTPGEIVVSVPAAVDESSISEEAVEDDDATLS